MTPATACMQEFAFPGHSSGSVATGSDRASVSAQLSLKDASYYYLEHL